MNELNYRALIKPDLSVNIDVQNIPEWPKICNNTDWIDESISKAASIGFDFSDSRIIEISNGPAVPIGHTFKNTDVDIVCDSYRNCKSRIIKMHEAKHQYDIGIICESLEFEKQPLLILNKVVGLIRPKGMLFVRFRPWTSIDGGFSKKWMNKAYAHLAMEINSRVVNKVVKPIGRYDSMINSLNLSVISRKIHMLRPDEYIVGNDDYLNIIMKRTWGYIDPSDAINIMSISSVDYLVMK